jgi:tetratricopeptide (TPR) repeat protein
MWEDAIQLLEEAPLNDPKVKYYQGWCHLQASEVENADQCFSVAPRLSPDYCFPNRIEAVLALQAVTARCPDDARAPYYLGSFWYASRRYAEAIACWEQARERDPNFPTTHRNLGLAYMNKRQNPEAAMAAYERAFALDSTGARVFFELDQLRKRLGEPNERRLALMEQHGDLVKERYDLLVEKAALLNLLGHHQDALELLLTHRFHPCEGGEGKVTAQCVASLVELAKHHLAAGRFTDAIDCLESAQHYPDNLGEGKLAGAQENHPPLYYLGRAHEALGQPSKANELFRKASVGLSEPSSPMYYNDQPPDMVFYQGLARAKLGDEQGARAVFQKLIDYSHHHMDDEVEVDYFAVSLQISWCSMWTCRGAIALTATT